MEPTKNTESHVVELIGSNKEIIHPYVEVNLKGGLDGKGIINTDGEINIDNAHPTGTATVEGIVQGEGMFTDEGNLVVTTHIADWSIQPVQNNKVLNFFRKV